MNSIPFIPPPGHLKNRPPRCEKCPYRSVTCGPRGPIDSPFVVVGESPGQNEIVKNLPFVGPSGKVIMEAVQQAGVQGIEPYYTNAICCMPKNKDSGNLADATQACNERLLNEIRAYPRKAILALGNAAVWALTGQYGSKITQVRGHIYHSDLAEHGVIAAVHPAFLLRGGGSSRLFKRDVSLACELSRGSNSRYKYVPTDTVVMETESDIRELLDILSASDVTHIAADLETTGFSPREDDILSHGFCVKPGTAYIVPAYLSHLIGGAYNPEVVKAKYIWQNGKFDVGFLRADFAKNHRPAFSEHIPPRLEQFYKHMVPRGHGSRWGFQYATCHEDTMLLSYCLDENNGIHGLEVQGNDWLGAPNWKGVLDQYLPKQGATYAMVPPDILYKYQGNDLGVTRQLFDITRPLIAKDPDLEKLYVSHLMPAQEELTYLEGNGFNMDQHYIDENKTLIGKEVEDADLEFQLIATKVLGRNVNPNSWQQVQKLLYVGGLNIAKGKILATDAKTLQAYPNEPGVKELQKVREKRKLLSQYVINLSDAREKTGRVHSTYKLHSTTTGRLASSDPVNLQNIVRDDRIKNQFCASPGNWLLSIDLSQAELRVLACLSKDKKLLEIFNSGVSIHPIVAKRFYGENYTKDQYQLAKAVTFGIVYGRDAYSIATEYQITPKQAQEYINSWFGQFPEARDFINACRMAPIQGKILKTPWGRKRRFGIVGPERYHDAGNQAANYPPQSMASDVTLETLYTIGPTLRKWGVKTVNIVHDDIINDLAQKPELVLDTIELVTSTMKEIPRRRGLTLVPFESDWNIGTHWGSLKKPKDGETIEEFLKKLAA